VAFSLRIGPHWSTDPITFDWLLKEQNAFGLIEPIKKEFLVGDKAHCSTFEPRIFPSELMNKLRPAAASPDQHPSTRTARIEVRARKIRQVATKKRKMP
jgi:hypothetical protein